MKWFGQREKDFAEAIRPELREIRSPVPGRQLLDRIVASRQAGARVILPDANVEVATRRRFLIPAALVAAMLLLLIPFAPRSERSTRVSSAEGVASEWFAGSIAFAKGQSDDAATRLPAMQFTHVDRLKPMTLKYLRSVRDSSGSYVARLNRVVTLQATTSDRVPSWLIVSRNEGVSKGRRMLALDSAVVARADLRLIRRTILETPFSRYDEIRVVQNFHDDSVTGGMRANGARVASAARPVAHKLPASAAPIIVDAMPPWILGAVALERGWSARATALGWAVREDDVLHPLELRVENEETISVPAGRFDCWVVRIQVRRRTINFWVRKKDGVVIRSHEREMSRGETREMVLVG